LIGWESAGPLPSDCGHSGRVRGFDVELGRPLGGADLVALFICLEFMIVATIPLVADLVPAARGTMLALNLGSSSLGRATGALIAPSLWMMGGMLWNGLAAGASTLCALGLLSRYIHDDR
jgi:predicted MFS family arabinose efflux permease